MRRCKFCGSVVADDTIICPNCFKAIPYEADSTVSDEKPINKTTDSENNTKRAEPPIANMNPVKVEDVNNKNSVQSKSTTGNTGRNRDNVDEKHGQHVPNNQVPQYNSNPTTKTIVITAVITALATMTLMMGVFMIFFNPLAKNSAVGTASNSNSSGSASGSSSDLSQVINTTDQNKKDDVIPVSLNNKIILDEIAEITFTKLYTTTRLNAPNTSRSYSYYSADSGKQFIILEGEYKNISSKRFDEYKNFDGTLIVDGKYEYSTVFIAFSNANGDDFYDEPDPMETMNVYIRVEVPDEVANNKSSVNEFVLDFLTDQSKETLSFTFKL